MLTSQVPITNPLISANPGRVIGPLDRWGKRTCGGTVTTAATTGIATVNVGDIWKSIAGTASTAFAATGKIQWIFVWSGSFPALLSVAFNKATLCNTSAQDGFNNSVTLSDQGSATSLAKVGVKIPYHMQLIQNLNINATNVVADIVGPPSTPVYWRCCLKYNL